jgi:hypothetical protein
MYCRDFESGIDKVELCVGDTPRNCELLKWTRRPKSQYINYTHHIPDGIPAWIRVRVTNNGMLYYINYEHTLAAFILYHVTIQYILFTMLQRPI